MDRAPLVPAMNADDRRPTSTPPHDPYMRASQRPTTMPPAKRKRRERVRWATAGAIVLGLGGLVGAQLTSRTGAPPPRVAEAQTQVAPTAQPAEAAPAEAWHGPEFVSWMIPSDKVQVHVVGQGFEVINTDPSLTGKEISISGTTTEGNTLSYSITVPPPAAMAAAN